MQQIRRRGPATALSWHALTRRTVLAWRAVPTGRAVLAWRVAIAAALCGLVAADGAQALQAALQARTRTTANPARPPLRTGGAPLLRLSPADFADGRAEPAGTRRPSARSISNAVARQAKSSFDPKRRSDLFWLWGQFLDHDLSLTGPADPAEAFDIPVPAGDHHFDPGATGGHWILFNRSIYDKNSGLSTARPRQQLNQITAALDGSMVYGSDPARTGALRTLDGSGELRTSAGDLLPFNHAGLDNAGGPSPRFYLAGDIRANENVTLTAMHTLWVREHNRQAGAIARANPGLSGDRIFERARARVVALLQVITYEEFLPLLIGARRLARYRGWKPAVDLQICQEFSAAAYRFGHSMVSGRVRRLKANGRPIDAGHLRLTNAFFAPHELIPSIGIEPYLRGAAAQRARRIDSMVIDELRNFLFRGIEGGGLDLAAMNIQRGRDHGLASYNDVREAYGLPRRTRFGELGALPLIVDRMRTLYGSIDDVDLWVGGLAEREAAGAGIGETFRAILAEQFQRTRDGDPDFYRNRFDGAALGELEATRLVDVIRRNSRIGDEISDTVMRAR